MTNAVLKTPWLVSFFFFYCNSFLVISVYSRVSHSQPDFLSDSSKDCLMAVYGGIRLTLRSAEWRRLMIWWDHPWFRMYLHKCWGRFGCIFLASLRPMEVQWATVLIMNWVKQLDSLLTFSLENFNYVSLWENFVIKRYVFTLNALGLFCLATFSCCKCTAITVPDILCVCVCCYKKNHLDTSVCLAGPRQTYFRLMTVHTIPFAH